MSTSCWRLASIAFLKIRAVTIHCAINRFQHLPPYAQVLDIITLVCAPGL